MWQVTFKHKTKLWERYIQIEESTGMYRTVREMIDTSPDCDEIGIISWRKL